MILNNLGSLPKSRLINGSVIPLMMTTLDEVFMTDRICSTHSINLTKKKSNGKYYCSICNADLAREWYKKNKETLKQQKEQFLLNNTEYDIVKNCKTHGDLTKNQVIFVSNQSIKCIFCQRLRVKKHRIENREDLLLKEKMYRDENRERLRLRDRIYKNKIYKEKKEIILKRSKEWHKKNKDKRRTYRIKKIYGINIDQYNEMNEKQKNTCAICKKPESVFSNQGNKIKSLSVDHNHITGKVRGLLCSKCNCLIGYSLESVDLLQEAIKYLKEHSDDSEG